MMFLDCPAYLDHDGAARCGLPAEVERHFTMSSSDGPAESAKISCPAGHWFNGAIESRTWEARISMIWALPGVAFCAGRDIARPNSAPAYYQGRPVHLWLSAMRPRRSRTASPHVMETGTGRRERTPSEHRLLAEAGSKPSA